MDEQHFCFKLVFTLRWIHLGYTCLYFQYVIRQAWIINLKGQLLAGLLQSKVDFNTRNRCYLTILYSHHKVAQTALLLTRQIEIKPNKW